jgi:L-alanine-DL-glutamate epimerase-like enolase superfamily enzyme
VRIAGVTATHFASGPAQLLCVELTADAGLTGIAIAPAAASADVERLGAAVLVGRDPRGVAGLAAHLRKQIAHGAAPAAVAALDLALWDLKARANDEPLWKTLGGSRPRANAHLSGLALTMPNASLAQRCRDAIAPAGLRAAEVEIGPDPEVNAARLELVATALARAEGATMLMVDAGAPLSPREIVRRVRALERDHDLTWVRAAGVPDVLGLKRVSDSVRCAVCAGDAIDDPRDFHGLLHHAAVDIVMLDIGRIGITAALEIADAAFGFELPVALAAAPANVHVHLAAALPSFMTLALADDAVAFGSSIRIEAGVAIAGDAPGNGCTRPADSRSA